MTWAGVLVGRVQIAFRKNASKLARTCLCIRPLACTQVEKFVLRFPRAADRGARSRRSAKPASVRSAKKLRSLARPRAGYMRRYNAHKLRRFGCPPRARAPVPYSLRAVWVLVPSDRRKGKSRKHQHGPSTRAEETHTSCDVLGALGRSTGQTRLNFISQKLVKTCQDVPLYTALAMHTS